MGQAFDWNNAGYTTTSTSDTSTSSYYPRRTAELEDVYRTESKPKKKKHDQQLESKIAKVIVSSKLFRGHLTISQPQDKHMFSEDISRLSRYNVATYIYIKGVNSLPDIGSQDGIVLLYTLDECEDLMSRAIVIKGLLVSLKASSDLPMLLAISKAVHDGKIEEAMHFAGAKDVWKPSQLEELPKDLNFMVCSIKKR